MQYYRVKPEADNKRLYAIKRGVYVNCGDILIAKELYTPKEWEKMVNSHVFGCNPADCVDTVEVSKHKIYWFFGARFEMEDNYETDY